MTLSIVLYLAFILLKDAKGQCSNFFPYGYGQVWQVQSGNDLTTSLNQFGSGDVIQLNVINGTKWVGLGGNVETFEAVIGRPPMTSSDLTLAQALNQINQTSIKGLINFDPKSYSSDEEELLINFAKHFPLWKLQNVEDEAHLNAFPTVNLALQWGQKKYGLDEVFARVQNENILLEFDFDKMKDILDKAFAKHTVEENHLKYLQRKYKTIKRQHQNSFTELFMQNLLHLVEHLSNMKDVEFLPDLQETQTTCDQNDLDLVESFIQKSGMVSQCTLLRIRAGIFLKPDCLHNLNTYLNNHNNVKLIIHALPHDFLPVKDFVTALNAVGKENVLLDLPQVAHEKIRTLSGFPAIPNTNRNYAKHQNEGTPLKDDAPPNTAIISHVKVIFIALLLVFF